MPKKYTMDDLLAMRAWPLSQKIQVTQTRLIEWKKEFNGQIYISFSGGKDSTVLERWINKYPRGIFNYKSAAKMFQQEFGDLISLLA